MVRARHAATGKLALLVHVTEAERLVHAQRLGVLDALLRSPRDPTLRDDWQRTTRGVLKHGERVRNPKTDRFNTIKRIKIIRGLPGIKYAPEPRPRPRKATPK